MHGRSNAARLSPRAVPGVSPVLTTLSGSPTVHESARESGTSSGRAQSPGCVGRGAAPHPRSRRRLRQRALDAAAAPCRPCRIRTLPVRRRRTGGLHAGSVLDGGRGGHPVRRRQRTGARPRGAPRRAPLSTASWRTSSMRAATTVELPRSFSTRCWSCGHSAAFPVCATRCRSWSGRWNAAPTASCCPRALRNARGTAVPGTRRAFPPG